MTARPGLVLLVLGLAACAAPPPASVRTAPRRAALLTSDQPLPPYASHRPVVAALDGRGLLGLWSVSRTGELEPLARRPILGDVCFLQVGQYHRPSVQEVVARVGSASLDAPRRLAVGLRVVRDGLGIEVGDRDSGQRVQYLLRPERWQLEVSAVASGDVPASSGWATTALVATTTGASAAPLQVERLLTGSALEPWRTHELCSGLAPPIRVTPPDQESWDLADAASRFGSSAPSAPTSSSSGCRSPRGRARARVKSPIDG